jgi:hypothetical protein
MDELVFGVQRVELKSTLTTKCRDRQMAVIYPYFLMPPA